jgi:transitional endoplasmic reticulum ATPase
LKENFNRARENTPAIIFIDEIESMAPSRDLYNSKFVEDVVTQFLQEMDGVKELKGVFLIGATNKPDMIDKALMRPGRLDKIVFIPPPLEEQRAEMFEKFLEKVPVAKLDYNELAENSQGFTGADIKSVCQEAKMELVRRATRGEKDSEITQRMLLRILSERKPSITVKMLQEYKKFQDNYGERK